MFSLESPHRCDSNEYKQHIYTIIKIKKKIILNYPKYKHVCSYGIFSWGLKNEFETAVVNEPSMFEQLRFYCILRISTVTKMTSAFLLQFFQTYIARFTFVDWAELLGVCHSMSKPSSLHEKSVK